jgi:outer membrane lipoprotein-sorting protein
MKVYMSCLIIGVITALAGLPGIAETQYGDVAALAQLSKMTSALSGANAVEYTSTIHTLNDAGRPTTLYVHARLEKPTLVWLRVSPSAVDAPDSDLVMVDGSTIFEYDPQQNRLAKGDLEKAGLALPAGFSQATPAFFSVKQFFSPKPFSDLLYSDRLHPIILTRRGLDLPGTVLLTSRWPGDLAGVEHGAQIWVDTTTNLPRRVVVLHWTNNVEGREFSEDFSSFAVNPKLSDANFHWPPPGAVEATVAPSTPVNAPESQPAAKPKKQTASPHKKPAPKKRRHGQAALSAAQRVQ